MTLRFICILFFITSYVNLIKISWAQDSGGINLTTETFIMDGIGTGGVLETGPGDKIAIATAHHKLSIEEKAQAVAKLIKISASRDTPLNIVIDVDPIETDGEKKV